MESMMIVTFCLVVLLKGVCGELDGSLVLGRSFINQDRVGALANLGIEASSNLTVELSRSNEFGLVARQQQCLDPGYGMFEGFKREFT
jgi:hypothetical protein